MTDITNKLMRVSQYLTRALAEKPRRKRLPRRWSYRSTRSASAQHCQAAISLETPTGEESSHVGDFIEDKRVISTVDAVISADLAIQTRKVLATLTPREEKVLRMRFGIGEKSEHSLKEVGQDFNVSRERVRQIEARALLKLRRTARRLELKSIIEE